jgi:hypothetical protein
VSHAFQSKGHNGPNGEEFDYSFVYDSGLSTGGMVKILVFSATETEEATGGMQLPKKLAEGEVHKNALVEFLAHLVRIERVVQIEGQNDMEVLGL